jgi:hypothetical protein
MQHHALGVDFRCRAVQPKNCAHRRGLLAAFSISSFGGCRGLYVGFPDRQANFAFVFSNALGGARAAPHRR